MRNDFSMTLERVHFMKWTSIRAFLNIPENLTGKNVNIAIIDSSFAHHPDISSNEKRKTYIVKTSDHLAQPILMLSNEGPWKKGLHGLSSAAAAAGSGKLSNGYYSGAAPAANLYLLETGPFYTSNDIEVKIGIALEWLRVNRRTYNIRGVILTVVATRDTGLLPWQADPVRILCEELADDGLLVVSSSGNTKELVCNGPAASPSVLSVGGVIVPSNADIHDANAYHGCRGITFENKWVPEILAPAENIVLPTPFQSEEERQNHFTASLDDLPIGYARTEGTSYSGPIILGAAACIWEARPSWTSFQVKSALLRSSRISQPILDELRSGLVDVSAAVNFMSKKEELSLESPYLLWKSWKRKEKTERLAAVMCQDAEEATIALLSFFAESYSLEMAKHFHTLLRHSSYKIRAASIILLSEHSKLVTSDDLRQLFKDSSSYVRMGALHAFSRYPDLWDDLTEDLIRLFFDTDSNIKYCALKLASTVKNPLFILPLISGLKYDALNQRVSIFGERCNALEQITGVHFESVPEWREGQCWYSERSTEARLDIARKWTEWKKQKC
jgi:hypothetical protein